MSARWVDVTSWVPVVVVAVVVMAVAVSKSDELGPPAGVQDVDVVVVDLEDPPPSLPTGAAPLGTVEAVTVEGDAFIISGWADFREDAYLVVRTSSSAAPRRLRARTLPRVDVSAALGETDLLYAGYGVTGSVAEFGMPTCVQIVDGAGSRVLWQSAGVRCV